MCHLVHCHFLTARKFHGACKFLSPTNDFTVRCFCTNKRIIPPPFQKQLQFETFFQKASNVQSELKTGFPEWRLRERNRFVGLYANEFKITHGWKCYRVYAKAVLFPILVVFCILNNWTISWRVKKHCPKTKDLFLICFSKGKNEYFLPASNYEEWIWRFLVKSIWASNCLRLK